LITVIWIGIDDDGTYTHDANWHDMILHFQSLKNGLDANQRSLPRMVALA